MVIGYYTLLVNARTIDRGGRGWSSYSLCSDELNVNYYDYTFTLDDDDDRVINQNAAV